jgi:hypothetical protein
LRRDAPAGNYQPKFAPPRRASPASSSSTARVRILTLSTQIPWNAGNLSAPYFMFERAADTPPALVKRPPANKPLKEFSAENAYEAAIARDTLQDYEEFLRDHPAASSCADGRRRPAGARRGDPWR